MKLFLFFLMLCFALGLLTWQKSRQTRVRAMLWLSLFIAATYYLVSGTI